MKRYRLWKQSCQPNVRNSNSSRKITKPANPLVQGVKLQQQHEQSLLWGNISCVLLSWLFPGSDFLYRGLIPYFIYKENKVNRIEPAPCNTLLHFLKNADLIISPHPHWLSNLMCRFWNFCLVFFLLPLKLAFSILNQSLLMKFHCQYKSKGGNFKFHSSVIAQTNQSPIPEHGVQKCPFYPSLGILCNFDSNHYLAYYSLYTDNMYSTYMHIPISF